MRERIENAPRLQHLGDRSIERRPPARGDREPVADLVEGDHLGVRDLADEAYRLGRSAHLIDQPLEGDPLRPAPEAFRHVGVFREPDLFLLLVPIGVPGLRDAESPALNRNPQKIQPA